MRIVIALDRGCRLIRLLTENEPMSIGEISQALGIPLSTTYELVHTLMSHGFVEEVDGGDGNVCVAPGYRLFEAGAAYVNRVSFMEEAQRAATGAAAELGEATHVAVLEGDSVVYVAKAESPQRTRIRIDSYIGGREPVHMSALGKCLLADETFEELQARLGREVLPALTPNTITDPAKLFEHVQDCRRVGYGVDAEESTIGVRCVAVPICAADGLTVAALSTTVPTSRLPKGQIPTVAKILRRHGDALEERVRIGRPIGWPR